MGRDDDGEPILLVDEDSRRRRANYSRGNFSVTSSPQQRGHQGSLDQAFASGSLAVEDPVSPTFALALYSGVLSRETRESLKLRGTHDDSKWIRHDDHSNRCQLPWLRLWWNTWIILPIHGRSIIHSNPNDYQKQPILIRNNPVRS